MRNKTNQAKEVKGVSSEVRKKINKLNDRNKKELDAKVARLHQEVFSELDCLSCANCCKTIPPILNNTDVTRLSKHLKIRESDFVNRYITIDEDGDQVMNQSPCPFLDDQNFCLVYENRPKACREYPHTNQKGFLARKRLHLRNSETCPAVFEILNKIAYES